MIDAGPQSDARPVTFFSHVRAVMLLPFMNTVIIPSILLLLFRDAAIGSRPLAVESTAAFASSLVMAGGLVLVVRSVGLFFRLGKGTLAPWDPTRVLITEDVYRFSRNPMKAGLFLILIGECILLRSTALAVWTGCFIVANVAYIRWFEEKGLAARFGSAYSDYCRRVPRWFGQAPTRQIAGRSRERFS